MFVRTISCHFWEPNKPYCDNYLHTVKEHLHNICEFVKLLVA